ncbi:3D domain-containing protein [Rummeliibacillus sp. G93]|nr:3D domain-containing protein [Rummeliibacillus sp. G93]UQW98947.1 3D domain-containing protein [Rummeliibacillus sp. G93]
MLKCYGLAIAGDIGDAIKGCKIDVYMRINKQTVN